MCLFSLRSSNYFTAQVEHDFFEVLLSDLFLCCHELPQICICIFNRLFNVLFVVLENGLYYRLSQGLIRNPFIVGCIDLFPFFESEVIEKGLEVHALLLQPLPAVVFGLGGLPRFVDSFFDDVR